MAAGTVGELQLAPPLRRLEAQRHVADAVWHIIERP